ncbi:C-C motif chemokine 4-like [Phascolarctos cinereus]|uniref:C-C motif chemokine n=1 Tax=Phascolarctos cinereus TaxID=38626 RepID=A0A6P5LRP1_PHACI|nr:C-C motif chemokine 4-like [Phascolarctos cinereus]
MKVSVAALSILMVMAFSSPANSVIMSSSSPVPCCTSHAMKKIPRKFVIDYYETSSLCPQPAVVFKTKKGRLMCANPSDDWVQKYVDDLQRLRASQA